MLDTCILILVELHIFKQMFCQLSFLAPAIVAGAVTVGVMQQIIRAFGRVEGSMQYIESLAYNNRTCKCI